MLSFFCSTAYVGHVKHDGKINDHITARSLQKVVQFHVIALLLRTYPMTRNWNITSVFRFRWSDQVSRRVPTQTRPPSPPRTKDILDTQSIISTYCVYCTVPPTSSLSTYFSFTNWSSKNFSEMLSS